MTYTNPNLDKLCEKEGLTSLEKFMVNDYIFTRSAKRSAFSTGGMGGSRVKEWVDLLVALNIRHVELNESDISTFELACRLKDAGYVITTPYFYLEDGYPVYCMGFIKMN